MGALDWLTRKLSTKQQEGPSHPALPMGVSVSTQSTPQFLGQQEGLAAELFEAGFRGALLSFSNVRRAYFCKLRYGNETINRGAICVVSATGPSPPVAEALAAVIHRHLDRSSNIDILFLSQRQEEEIVKTCTAFYNAV